MKVLISCMAAMAETSGPSSRSRALTKELIDSGFEAATCMAEDVNYKALEEIHNFFLDVPMPMGMPAPVSTHMFPFAQKIGVTSKKTVASFDQVLKLTGNLEYGYLRKSVDSVRSAIAQYKPDILYSEFNLSAIIASKLENIPVFTTVSYPASHAYANDPTLAKGLNRLLAEYGIPEVESALKVFGWADRRFCPSIRELEPIDDKDVRFLGTFKKVETKDIRRDKILVYMGNGTVSAKATLKAVSGAFSGSGYEVYLASSYLAEGTEGNIHIALRWDFDELLDASVLFINHGGQNSIADGLLHGVPQIVVPGKVFERQYNAQSILTNGAGVTISHKLFNADTLKIASDKVIGSEDMAANAKVLGAKLMSQGGVKVIINAMENFAQEEGLNT